MYAERIAGLKSSAIRDILKVTSRKDMISFAGGLPAPELFPLREIEAAAHRVLTKQGPAALQYSITEGILTLREKIAARMSTEALSISTNNILITQGSQQGLDLISKLYLNKGSIVLTENPSYLGALQAFRIFQADIVPVSSDADGIQPDALKEVLKKCKPAFLYLMPNFQNPTGTSLSLERRHDVVRIALEHGLLVIEDNPYGELVFEGTPLPTLFSIAQGKNVIYLSTFSKTIAPGLRVAYAVAEEESIGKLALVKQGTDLQTNTFGQYIVEEYLESGQYEEHLRVLRQTYKARRDQMLAAMQNSFPSSITVTRPAGGMFLWATLPEQCDAKEILVNCLDRNVAFVPGQEFFPDNSGKNTLRLNFSNASLENIETGIKRMGAVLHEVIA